MKTKRIHQHITCLWAELRNIIDQTYQANIEEDAKSLRDYARNQSWSDDLEKLLADETANERQHRSLRAVRGFSSSDAAKLIICGNVLRGSELAEMPSALTFITFRHSAAEANLLGYLVRANVTPEWKRAVESLDYAECMQQS